MTSAKEYIQSVFETVKARNGHEAEFLQAVEEFFSTLEPVFEKHPEYIEENILARITEPERVISFRVPWVDRDGKFKLTVVTVFNLTLLLDHIKADFVSTQL